MKIIKKLADIALDDTLKVACLGYFDGLHQGHQKLLTTTLQLAKTNNMESLFFTFSQSPKQVVSKQYFDELLSLEDKITLINDFGFNNFVIFPFNEDTRQWTVTQFIAYLKQLKITKVVVGSDFRFGYKGLGTIKDLQDNFKEVIIVNEVTDNNHHRISTTHIRNLLQNKQLHEANKLLLVPYSIKGVVQHGSEIGRLINFPTANLHLPSNYKMLAQGVYITEVKYENKVFQGISCIFKVKDVLKCETYIFNFNKMIYGQMLQVFFLEYIRDNVAIKDLQHLKKLLTIDKNKALEYFSKIS